MKIFIKYENIKTELNIEIYQSINSIINQYLTENNIQDNINNYFLEINIFSPYCICIYLLKWLYTIQPGNAYLRKRNMRAAMEC